MQESLILAPGINGAEFLKCLALKGVKSFNTRVCNGVELASLLLMRAGLSIKEQGIGFREECQLIAKAAQGISYFGELKSADVEQIALAIRSMRQLVGAGDESELLRAALRKGQFAVKNQALLQVYDNYLKDLQAAKLLDAVGLIRKALSMKVEEKSYEIITFKEFPVSPLLQALVEHVGSQKEISIQEFLGLPDHGVKLQGIKKCYGAPNEVESILADIYENKCLDKCTVAVADGATYGQLFLDYALLYDIPMTFGCGLSMLNTNPAKLLKLYCSWIGDGFFKGESLLAMLKSEVFNGKALLKKLGTNYKVLNKIRFFDMLVTLRLSNDPTLNQQKLKDLQQALKFERELCTAGSKDDPKLKDKESCLPFVEALARELELPVGEFISEYAFCRDDKSNAGLKLLKTLDQNAKYRIKEEFERICKDDTGIIETPDLLETAAQILSSSIGNQGFEEGKLHITTISGAFSALRDNLYIAGLGALQYPGSPKENYLLLDEDLRNLGPQATYKTSEGIIKAKQELLVALLKLATATQSEVQLSYAGMDVAELKASNPSSVLYELYKMAQGANRTIKEFNKHITEVGYFEPAIAKNREIGKSYIAGDVINPESRAGLAVVPDASQKLDKAVSPSALEKFFQCPKLYMFKYILSIPEPDEEENVFTVISAADEGTMAHLLMEQLAEKSTPNSKLPKNQFMKLVEECFDNYLLTHPPVLAEQVDKVKKSFLEMMDNAYEQDPGRKVLLKEVDISAVHASTGVKLHGFPDRVEELDNGTYLIVDYKTGRNIKHETDDINTCLQTVIYSLLIESMGYTVSGSEYRYPRVNKTVTCKYDAAIQKALTDKLEIFKAAMTSGEFPCTTKDDNCKYCKYGRLCGKK